MKIQAVNIHKAYGSRHKTEVLKDVSLTIPKGSYTVILGASGSGKSTLLNVLSGLERCDSGSLLYDSTDITKMNDSALTAFRKEDIGFIFQQYYLLENMNVEKNVRMGADLVQNKQYHEIIEAVGLKDKLKQYPSELSGGEQQQVSIARALAKNPHVLFLDEPTGALVEQCGRQILDLDYIMRLHQERHFTILMVTHNQNIAETADTVIRMNSGRITEMIENAHPKSAYEIGW